MWAFSDESERGAVMVVGTVFVVPGAIDDARLSLRGLLLPGQRRIHTTKESPRRRRVIIDRVARTDGLAATVLRYRRPAGVNHMAARRTLIEAAAEVIVQQRRRGRRRLETPP